jgi:hypothetical protein
LYFKNGSKFQFLTAEQDVDKHAGQTLDRVHFDEEPPGAKGYELYQGEPDQGSRARGSDHVDDDAAAGDVVGV